MNWLSLPGPKFFVVYVLLGLALFLACWVRMRFFSGERLPISEMTKDPYRLAYLRAGRVEALRVAIFNLVDRGILAQNRGRVAVARDDALELVRRPLERAIVQASRSPIAVADLERHPGPLAVIRVYDLKLRSGRLLPDAREWLVRFAWAGASIGVLIAVAVSKYAVARASGHSNVQLLIIACVAGVMTCGWTVMHRLTGHGRGLLDDVQSLLSRLRDGGSSRLMPGGATNDAVMLAAAFGVHALPEERFRSIFELFPRSVRTSWWDIDGNSAINTTTNCGTCCSSGCGGGGGCGGCGG